MLKLYVYSFILFFSLLSIISITKFKYRKEQAINLDYMKNKSRENIGYILLNSNYHIGLEIGVQRAIFSNQLLKIWSNCIEYTMIDPWIKQKNYDDGANVDLTLQNQRFIQAMKVVQNYPNITFKIFKTKSEIISNSFAYKSYDFIYIDGRHDYYSVKNDIDKYFPLLKDGGILSGDDYSYSPGRWKIFPDGTVDKLNRAVKGAVDEFIKRKRLKLVLSKDKSWFTIKI